MDAETPINNLTNKLTELRSSLNESEQALLDHLILQDNDENDVQAHGGGGRLPLILLEENQYVPGGGGYTPGGGGFIPGGGGFDPGGGGYTPGGGGLDKTPGE